LSTHLRFDSLDVLPFSFLSLYKVVLELSSEQFLVLFINEFDKFHVTGGLLISLEFTTKDLICIQEPNCAVVITGELGTHFEDLDTVHLLNVITHFEALLMAVGIPILRANQVNVLALGTEIVPDRLDCVTWLVELWSWGPKIDHNRVTEARSRLDTCLHVAESVIINSTCARDFLSEFRLRPHLQIINSILFNILIFTFNLQFLIIGSRLRCASMTKP